MTNYLAQLTIPGYGEIQAPDGIPQGGEGTLSNILSVGIQIFLVVVIIASLAYLVWAGVNWITSSGDAQKVAAARQQIIYAVIGLGVAFLSFALIALLGGVFGINLI